MRNIAELNVVLHIRVESKTRPKPETAESHESWRFFTGDASKVEKKIRTGEWNFIKIPTVSDERCGRKITWSDYQRALNWPFPV